MPAFSAFGSLDSLLPLEAVESLRDEARGGNHIFTVDLPNQTVTSPSGAAYRFEIDPGRKEKMLKGLDAIGETLQHEPDITAFEARRHSRMSRNEPGQPA